MWMWQWMGTVVEETLQPFGEEGRRCLRVVDLPCRSLTPKTAAMEIDRMLIEDTITTAAEKEKRPRLLLLG